MIPQEEELKTLIRHTVAEMVVEKCKEFFVPFNNRMKAIMTNPDPQERLAAYDAFCSEQYGETGNDLDWSEESAAA